MEEKEIRGNRLAVSILESASKYEPCDSEDKLFEIKEISIQEALVCNYSPGCDCTPY